MTEVLVQADLRSLITPGEVAEVARNTVRGFHVRLELTPRHIFDVAFTNEGTRSTATIAIDAITGRILPWPYPIELGDYHGSEHQRLGPELSRAQTEERARTRLHELDDSSITTMVDHGGVRIRTNRPLALSEDLELDFLGLYFAPVYLIEGTRGHLRFDAISGKILEEAQG